MGQTSAGGSLEGTHGPDHRRARGVGAPPQSASDRGRRAGHPKKSHGGLREAGPMWFAFIAGEKADDRARILGGCMRVTRSGFYAPARRGERTRAQRDVVLRTKL